MQIFLIVILLFSNVWCIKALRDLVFCVFSIVGFGVMSKDRKSDRLSLTKFQHLSLSFSLALNHLINYWSMRFSKRRFLTLECFTSFLHILKAPLFESSHLICPLASNHFLDCMFTKRSPESFLQFLPTLYPWYLIFLFIFHFFL